MRPGSCIINSYTIYPSTTEEASDLSTFLQNQKNQMVDYINEGIIEYNGIKFYSDCVVQLEKKIPNDEGEIHTVQPVFKTNPEIALRVNDFDVSTSKNRILNLLENYNNEGSGWVFKKVSHLILYILPYTPLEGSSFIPTPTYIKKKKCILNIHNDDKYCFLYSIIASRHPQNSDPHNASLYKQYVN